MSSRNIRAQNFIHSFSRAFLVPPKSLADKHLNAFIHSLHVFMPSLHTQMHIHTFMQYHLLATTYISIYISMFVHWLAIGLSFFICLSIFFSNTQTLYLWNPLIRHIRYHFSLSVRLSLSLSYIWSCCYWITTGFALLISIQNAQCWKPWNRSESKGIK